MRQWTLPASGDRSPAYSIYILRCCRVSRMAPALIRRSPVGDVESARPPTLYICTETLLICENSPCPPQAIVPPPTLYILRCCRVSRIASARLRRSFPAYSIYILRLCRVARIAPARLKRSPVGEAFRARPPTLYRVCCINLKPILVKNLKPFYS